MRKRGQYGREVRHYSECWAPEHGPWDRRMPEVVAVPAADAALGGTRQWGAGTITPGT